MDIKLDVTSPTAAKVFVEGDVDMHTSTQLREILMDAIQKKMTQITVDLTKVGFMDSSGIATLVEVLQELRKIDGKLVLSSLSEIFCWASSR